MRGLTAPLLGALALACLLWPQVVSATPADREATNAFLEADYEFERTAVANIPASLAAVKGLAAKLEGECPRVLAGAPALGALVSFAKPSPAQTSQIKQLLDLDIEITLAPVRAWLRVDQAAAATFAQALRPLHWSDPRLTRLVRAEIPKLEESFGALSRMSAPT
jgi:hypothetical protein